MAPTGKRTTVRRGVSLSRRRLLFTGALLGWVALPAGSKNLAEAVAPGPSLHVEVEEVVGEKDSATTANGLVLAVTSTGLAVASVTKGLVEVRTDASTVILREGAPITRAELQPGDQVRTVGSRITAHALLAREIAVRVPPTTNWATVSTNPHAAPGK